MISDFEAFHGRDPRASSWQKVTRRIVDPITFSCRVNVVNVPRIEDCSYETINIAIGQPLFEERLPISVNGTRNSGISSPSSSGRAKVGGSASNRPTIGSPSKQSSIRNSTASQYKKMVKQSKSGTSGDGPKSVASLGAFFSKTSVNDVGDIDSRSLSSRSMNSRSVSELSNAERSKAEDRLKNRRKNKMLSIDEQSASGFEEGEKSSSKGGSTTSSSTSRLGNFLKESSAPSHTKVEDDNRSTMSASTLGSKVSRMSSADRSKYETQLKAARGAKARQDAVSAAHDGDSPVKEKKKKQLMPTMPLKSILKKESSGATTGSTKKLRKLEIKDGHDIQEMPTLDDKEWYRDWDDIWYTEEELADMRYEAFLEEAGLDVGEYMNM